MTPPRPIHCRRAWPVLLLGATLGACSGFREVVPGVYRSPQPTETLLFDRIDEYGFRSVLCLRGGKRARLAARVADATGAELHVVTMSAMR